MEDETTGVVGEARDDRGLGGVQVDGVVEVGDEPAYLDGAECGMRVGAVGSKGLPLMRQP